MLKATSKKLSQDTDTIEPAYGQYWEFQQTTLAKAKQNVYSED